MTSSSKLQPQIELPPSAEEEVDRELKSVIGVEKGKKVVLNEAQAQQASKDEPANEDVAKIARLEHSKKIKNKK